MMRAAVAGAGVVFLYLSDSAFGQTSTSGPTSAPAVSAASTYGLWVIAPAMVAIILAILTRQVVMALSLGTLTASAMVCILGGDYNPIHFVTTMIERYVLGVLAPVKDGRADLEHLTILIYTFFIGAMIGVLNVNGGTRAVVELVTRRVKSRRGAQLAAGGSGLAVFFDDYASAMIVGPGLRPIFDRLRISREKLAQIVNWTAAPVSSMFLGTWLAVQIGWINDGMDGLRKDGMPAFLASENAAHMFWACIPYRAYSVLVIAAVFVLAMFGRDWGAMRKAESRVVEGDANAAGAADNTEAKTGHWAVGVIPAAVLVGLTVGLMVYTGIYRCHADNRTLNFDSVGAVWNSIEAILGKADSHAAMLYASLAAAVIGVVVSVVSRSCSLSNAMEGAVSGMSAMFAASIILVLAWGLSQASKDLQLGQVAEAFLRQQIELKRFSVEWLPLSIFLTACFISFSTGSSWATMALLVPPAVSISGGLLREMPADVAYGMFLSCVGSAMAGAVFGNTCSPLADVTVLSAMFSGCDLGSHVRTVTPYAILIAMVSVLSTDGLRLGMAKWTPGVAWNVWYGLASGVLLLVLWTLIVGRRPKGVVFEPAIEAG